MPDRKLTEAVLYVCSKFKHNPSLLGKSRLHKTLFYSDFEWFRKTMSPITEATYMNHQFGPVVSELDDVLEELTEKGRLVQTKGHRGTLPTHLFIALDEPEVGLFSPEELLVITNHAARLQGMPVTQITNETHDMPAWKDTSRGDTIGYHFALGGLDEEASEETVAWTERLIEKRGLRGNANA